MSIKPKILFIVNVDWFFVSHRLPIAIHAINNGFDVYIATKFTIHKNLFLSKNIKTYDLNLERSSNNVLNLISNLIRILNIIRILKPNIVHFISLKPILIGSLSRFFYKSIPFVFSFPGTGNLFTPIGLLQKIRLIFFNFILRIMLKEKNNFFIFQNKSNMLQISEICNINNESKILISGSGVNLDDFKPNYNKNNPPIILFASRLLITKGIMEFVEAAKEIREARFIIAGMLDKGNPDCIDISLIRKWENDRCIEYVGYQRNMSDLFSQSSIFVLPSYYSEGLPKVLIEAAASGIPVITTDHSGCRDAIKPGITGILVPIKDSISLIKSIRYLLSFPEIQNNMGRQGRKLAEEKFSIKNVIETHFNIYISLINNKNI